ncbi:hypothetical protein [Bacillus sp. FJAT-27225]|uniref:hypothetical protein n=1 Tax=Bacillus sp. FJAT-27225 TaxID=1743144 RepID=UPI001586E8B6|nr:hypothetical protein [Bacillus sp. FJAT-27225]
MYDVHLLTQLKAKEVEQLSREAWKFQRSLKEWSFFKGWFDRKNAHTKERECTCVC